MNAVNPTKEGLSMKNVEVKIYKLDNDLYQIEAGKKAIVLAAKSRPEALKKACRYLPIDCNKIALQTK